MLKWGGIMETIFHYCSQVDLYINTEISSLCNRLKILEDCKSIEETRKALNFSEKERNYLNSDLLDQIYSTIGDKSPLYEAAAKGYMKVFLFYAEKMVFSKFEINMSFIYACNSGNIELVVYLLSLGAEKDYLGGAGIKWAARQGHLEIVKKLMDPENKIHINEAFTYAAPNGHLEVVKYLLENGANVQYDFNFSLRLASRNGHEKIVSFLLDNGADIHAVNDEALREAAIFNKPHIVKLLIERGAEIHAMDDWALRLATYYGNLEVVRILVERGADIHAQYDIVFSIARNHNRKEVLEYLSTYI